MKSLHAEDVSAHRHTVLFLSDETDLTGATVVLLRVMRGLDRRRFGPVAFIHEANTRLASALRDAQVPFDHSDAFGNLRAVHGLEAGIGWRKTLARTGVIAQLTPALARCIRRRRVDLVHANNYPLALYCAPAAVLTRTPFIFHDHNLREIRSHNRLNYRAVGGLCRLAVVVSDACKRNLAPVIDPRKIVVIRNGVELPPARPGVAEAVRASLGVGPADPLLAIIGQPREEKGIHVFIEAAAAIVRVFPTARFLVVGYVFDGDPYHQRLERLTDSLGLRNHLVFTGWRDDIPDVTAAIDLLVHCRLTPEPAALVLIESMAAGKPVVVSDTGGSAEIVVDGVTGMLYPPGNARALADAAIRLLGDRDRLKHMGASARARVEEAFTVERQVREFEDLYARILRVTS